MWDYIAFFGYNFLFFLFALFVWHVFPRPTPYDYTTIPGLKTDPDAIEHGNLNELKSCGGSLCKFLDYLHQDYGPLASFYWGRTYVVAIGNERLYRDLLEYCRKIPFTVDVIPIPNVPNQETKLASMMDSKMIAEKIRIWSNGRTVDEESDYWRLAADIVEENDRASEGDGTRDAAEEIASFERSLMNDSLPEGSTSHDIAKYRNAIIRRAVKRCLTSANHIRSSFSHLLENGTKQSLTTLKPFSDLPDESLLRSSILESIRSSVPFEYLLYTFDAEIDLFGHPIPAGVPILVYLRNVFVKHSDLNEPSSFIPDRFLNTPTFDQCVNRLPYRDLLASCILAGLSSF